MSAAPTSAPEKTSSAVEEEISRFASQASEWWDPKGAFAPLHAMNPVRIGYIRDHIAPGDTSVTPLKGVRILDVGCGGGLLSEPLARLGAEMTSIDAAAAGIEAAKAHAATQGLSINYQCTTAEALLADMQQTDAPLFDAVCALEIIEHVADPASFMQTISQLVRPGGQVLLSTLNKTPLSFAVAIVGAEYITRQIPRGTHDWRKFLSPSDLAGHCRAAGLQVNDVMGMLMNPLNNSWSLSRKRIRINYIMATSKPE